MADLDAEYVERMEDVLDIYEKDYDPLEPVVCVDEKPVQLAADVREAWPMAPGKPLRPDYEYKRHGVANTFYMVEPKAGKHAVKVTESRSSAEFAQFMRELGRAYPRAHKIHVVFDNFSTHTKRALIQNLGPRRGANLWQRFEVHYTPKHGSWLNQAEIGLSMYARECLGSARIPTIGGLAARSWDWQSVVNAERRTINWRFTKKKARDKFGYSRRRGVITMPVNAPAPVALAR